MTIERTRPPHGGHGERGITVLLKRMSDVVASEGSAQTRLDALTKVIASHVVADVCSIYLRRPNDVLELYSTQGLKLEAVHNTRLNWGEGLVGLVAQSMAPLVTADAPVHPAFSYRPETGEDLLRSFLGMPLVRSGKAIGVLVLQNTAMRQYTDEEIEAVQAVATLLAEIAASGELLSREETEAVGEVLHRPELLSGAISVPGIAIGRAFFQNPRLQVHKVFADDIAHEAERLEDGLTALRQNVDSMIASNTSLSGVSREVLEAYRLFAYDRGWKERMRAAVFSGLTAEAAVDQVHADNRNRLMQARDPYLRERLHDLEDLSHRLLRILAGEDWRRSRQIYGDTILVTRSMGPAELLEYDRERLAGLVVAEASPTSHVAIVARALKIPMITGIESLLDSVQEGETLIIDGEAGFLHVRPTSDIVESFREKRELQTARQAEFAKERDLPSVTKDGAAIDIMINAGLALDLPNLHETGAQGVGLFRTELQFLIGTHLPSAGAQEQLYAQVLDLADGKPVVFRTADIGADKTAPYMQMDAEVNPAMGWRGLRMALDRPGMIRQQLRALLGAGAGREVHIMFPLVTLADELQAVRRLLDREIERRKKRGKELPLKVHLGAMIETPAAAWGVETIAKEVDFLSVGGNDLAQFFFAADRDSERMHRRFDMLNPAFLGFLRHLVEQANKTGRPISYCGEQAADPIMAAALIATGFKRFSLSASAVGPFRRLVRSLDHGAVKGWLDEKIASADQSSLREDLQKFLVETGATVA